MFFGWGPQRPWLYNGAFTSILGQFSNLCSADSRICTESYGRAQNALSHEKHSVHIAAPPKVMINRAVAMLTA